MECTKSLLRRFQLNGIISKTFNQLLDTVNQCCEYQRQKQYVHVNADGNLKINKVQCLHNIVKEKQELNELGENVRYILYTCSRINQTQ